jgi:hypothetical protein
LTAERIKVNTFPRKNRLLKNPGGRNGFKNNTSKKQRNIFGEKGYPGIQKSRNELYNRHGTPKFPAIAKKFIQEYGLPDDWDTLFLFLDYKDPRTVKDVILKLKGSYRERSLTAMQGFRAKLEIISTTTSDKGLRIIIQEVINEL